MAISPSPDRLVIGRIGLAYGVKGWLKVHSYTEPSHNILSYNPWLIKIKEAWQSHTLLQGRKHGKGIIALLEGCHNREQATQLQRCTIAIQRSQLPNLAKHEFYWFDLLGLNVFNCEQVSLGKVVHLMETGANDVLIVRGDKEHLIPYLPDSVIKKIDLQRKLMIVDWDPEF